MPGAVQPSLPSPCAIFLSTESGFSIAEAVVALAVIATGVLTMSGLALRSTDVVTRSRHRSVATHLADAAVAELASRPLAPASADCLLSDTPGCVEYRGAAGEVVGESSAIYVLRWSSVVVAGAPVPAHAVTVCAVPVYDRAPAARPPGACVARVVMAVWP